MLRKILVIEDNKDLAHLLKLHMEDLSFQVDLAFDGAVGLTQVANNDYHLIILDLMLPEVDGLEICRQIRSNKVYIPIIMLTSKSAELDRILGLEMGADDYVTKPFSIRELMARVKAVFRRSDEIQSGVKKDVLVVRTENMMIDPEKRKVMLEDREIELTAKEFDLLLFFASHAGKVFTRSQLLDSVWGYGHDGYEHTVNSHINRLRAKIEKNPGKPIYILTVWGVGYQFAEFENKGDS